MSDTATRDFFDDIEVLFKSYLVFSMMMNDTSTDITIGDKSPKMLQFFTDSVTDYAKTIAYFIITCNFNYGKEIGLGTSTITFRTNSHTLCYQHH